MKPTTKILALIAACALAPAAFAQVEVTITGSTAFRAITIDRAASLFDANTLSGVTNNATTGQITYSGTMAGKVPSLGNQQVKIRLSFSGSAAGMLAVKNQTPLVTSEAPGTNVNKVADLALSDVFPGSASPPIPESSFDRAVVGIVPFVFAKNNSLAGVTNITRDQAVLLMTASGNGGMPASFLGGASANPVYLIGRDSGSGTRISVEKDIGFIGTPLLWATNGAGVLITTNGYSSGGNVRQVVAGTANTIGYLGLADLASIAASATALSYNGVPFSVANVANGSYAIWGYQHLVNRVGGLSANQALVRDALIAAITDPAFQTGNALYNAAFVPNAAMQVERGADGGTITSLNF